MAGTAFSQQGHVNSVIIGGKNGTLTSGLPSTLGKGEIGLFLDDGKNTRATAANAATAKAAGTKLKFIWKDANGKIQMSPAFPSTAVIRPKKYTAPQQAIGYFGFNGVSGAITADNFTEYRATILLRETVTSSVDGKHVPNYSSHVKSDGTGTQEEIASGLLRNFVNMFSKRLIKYELLKFELLASTAADALLGTGVGSLTFTKGSKVVSVTDVDDTTGGNPILAVGNYIRVGTTAADPVYKITAINTTTNTFSLDVPFAGEDTVIADDADAKHIAAANLATPDFGIKVRGVAMGDDEWSLNKTNYGVVNFTLLDAYGNLTVTSPENGGQIAKKGVGHKYEMAQFEAWGEGADGRGEHYLFNPHTYDKPSFVLTDTLTIVGYDQWHINWDETYTPGIAHAPAKKAISVVLPTDRGNDAVYADNGQTNAISNVVATFLGVTAGDLDGVA